MTTRYYTGIGSRKTPREILMVMWAAGRAMAELGYVLRSGGAEGADSAFEEGAHFAKGICNIYLPWKGFRGNESTLYPSTPAARRMARDYHPKWEWCSPTAKKLLGRNPHQVLGRKLLTPSDFVLCWTEGGLGGGGTGLALRIARDKGIPVHDFGTGNLDWKYLLEKTC